MRIGVPTEIKTDEYRVGMTPAGAAVLVHDGTTIALTNAVFERTHQQVGVA